MVTQYFNIGSQDWGMLLCYNYSMADSHELIATMQSFGLTKKKAKEALRVLSRQNTGMTISNMDLRMSVVFVSDAESEEQWWNTVSHELYHVGVAIIDYYNEDYDGESAAYLQGYLMEQVIRELAPPCH